MMKETIFLFFFLIIAVAATAAPSPAAGPRPPAEEDAVLARRLVHSAAYGVLTTLDNNGFPFGNVVSHSDGGTGTPYFYLALDRDPTGVYALKNPRASFTVSQAALGTCDLAAAQSPECTKITLTGEVRFLNLSTGAGFGERVLFADHPAFARWPSTHDFGVFMLRIDRIFLVNGFKAAVNLPVKKYYSARPPAQD